MEKFGGIGKNWKFGLSRSTPARLFMGKYTNYQLSPKVEKFILNTKYYQNSGQGQLSATSFCQ
jgi:hypothetical protein